MASSLDFSVVLTGDHLRSILHGVLVTVELTGVTWLSAFTLAVALTIVRSTDCKLCKWMVAAYVEIHQNIPLLVLLMFWYFVIPELLPESARIWLNERNSEFILAWLALSFCSAAYMSEALRSGLRAISTTQYEAGRALGFGFLRTMRYIIIPQAVRVAAPPLVNYSLLLFKNTSIAMAIGVAELTYQARDIENTTFRTFEIFAVTTAIYLAFSFAIMAVGSWYERRCATGTR